MSGFIKCKISETNKSQRIKAPGLIEHYSFRILLYYNIQVLINLKVLETTNFESIFSDKIYLIIFKEISIYVNKYRDFKLN